jgi:hypothetical protein
LNLRLVLITALFLSVSCASKSTHPVAFTSDGCSASPDGTLSNPGSWKQACTIHDYRYWRGGLHSQRRQADRELASNMAKAGNPVMGNIYYLGVRIGGSAWLPTSWRWGYAWDYPRGYHDLTAEEQAALDDLMPGPPSLQPQS